MDAGECLSTVWWMEGGVGRMSGKGLHLWGIFLMFCVSVSGSKGKRERDKRHGRESWAVQNYVCMFVFFGVSLRESVVLKSLKSEKKLKMKIKSTFWVIPNLPHISSLSVKHKDVSHCELEQEWKFASWCFVLLFLSLISKKKRKKKKVTSPSNQQCFYIRLHFLYFHLSFIFIHFVVLWQVIRTYHIFIIGNIYFCFIEVLASCEELKLKYIPLFWQNKQPLALNVLYLYKCVNSILKVLLTSHCDRGLAEYEWL